MILESGAKKIIRHRRVLTGITVYPEYELNIDLMLDKNQHHDWSNILACQIFDIDSYMRLWNGINGDRNWAYHKILSSIFCLTFVCP